MADITINIPDANLARVRTSFLAAYPKENGYTDLAWFKEVVRRWLLRIVKEQEEKAAVQAAQAAANAAVETAKSTVIVPDNLIG